jgi:hypothetical protein
MGQLRQKKPSRISAQPAVGLPGSEIRTNVGIDLALLYLLQLIFYMRLPVLAINCG